MFLFFKLDFPFFKYWSSCLPCRDQAMDKWETILSYLMRVMGMMRMSIAKPYAEAAGEITILIRSSGLAATSVRGGSMGSVWRLRQLKQKVLSSTNVPLAAQREAGSRNLMVKKRAFWSRQNLVVLVGHIIVNQWYRRSTGILYFFSESPFSFSSIVMFIWMTNRGSFCHPGWKILVVHLSGCLVLSSSVLFQQIN